MYVEGFTSKLKHARSKTGFTQREVSKETGIPQSTLANYETGRTQPDIESIGILADFYGINLNWLFGTKGDQEIYHPTKERLIITDKQLGIQKKRLSVKK